MRREPVYLLTKEGSFVIKGFEILADFPYLLVNPKIDFATFKTHIEQINKENQSGYIYHLNIKMETLQEKLTEVINVVNSSPFKDSIVVEILEEDIDERVLDEIISKLVEHGIKISIDDFGTKSSNFDRLVKYKGIIESIKIDRILWKNMPYVVKAMLEDVNINIIAEKVETKEELKFLSEMGIKLFQGWYFKNNLKDLEEKLTSLDMNNFDEDHMFLILKESISMLLKSREEKNIDNLLKYFKIIYLAYKLNIPLKGEEFDKIKRNILSSNYTLCTNSINDVIKREQKIFKYIMGELLIFFEKIEEFKKELAIIANQPNSEKFEVKVNEFSNIIKKLHLDLKEKEIELKLLVSQVDSVDNGFLVDKSHLKKMILNAVLEVSKSGSGVNVVILYFPQLDNIQKNIGYSFYEKVFKKITENLRKFFPSDINIINYDTTTFLMFVHSWNSKFSIKLEKLFHDFEVLVDKKFINLKPNVGVFVVEKKENEKIDDVIVRLETRIYETKHYI